MAFRLYRMVVVTIRLPDVDDPQNLTQRPFRVENGTEAERTP